MRRRCPVRTIHEVCMAPQAGCRRLFGAHLGEGNDLSVLFRLVNMPWAVAPFAAPLVGGKMRVRHHRRVPRHGERTRGRWMALGATLVSHEVIGLRTRK